MEDPSIQPPESESPPKTQAEPQTTVPTPQPAGQTPAPKAKGGVFHFLFNTQTRLGRFNRAALRVLATVLGLFALGLLAGYLLLYRPSQQELARTRADLTQANQRTDGLQTSLTQAQQQRDSLTKLNQDLQKQTDSANQHALLYQAMNDTTLARLALAQNNPTAAQQALKDAPAALLKLTPAIDAQNNDLLKTIQARISLAVSEIQSDPKTAASDLGILNDQFIQLEKRMAAGQ